MAAQFETIYGFQAAFQGNDLISSHTLYHISSLTYAYLIVRLSISDTLKLKLIERFGKLPLGCRQT